MKPELLLTARLTAHGFEPSKFTTPLEVVTAFGAMQAQDYGQALWAIGSRIPDSTRQDIEAALNRFEIIRTWSMRGTIHFVPAVDAKWMVNLLTPRITAKLKSRRAELNVTQENLDRCTDILKKALSGKVLLTRPQIFELFEEVGEPTANQRGYHILLELAQRGLIFIGPNSGKQPTFGLLDEFVASRALSRDESLRTIATRFFTGHAPASLEDFAYWSGLTIADARKAIELASKQLMAIEIKETTYFAGTAFRVPIAPIKNSVHLMAGFDEYFLPYRNRHTIIDIDHANHVVPGGNGVFKPTIVIDGKVCGVWTRQIKARSVKVTAYLFPGNDCTVDQLSGSLAAYGHFAGAPVDLVIEHL
jgi:hypothetical protein